MKTITAAVAVAGCMTAWPACAGRAVDEAMHQAQLVSGNVASDEHRVVPGLLGAYPASREASGTSWQPDSTPHDVRGSVLQAPGTEVLFGLRNDRFSLPESATTLFASGALGSGTVGLQSTVSIYSFVGAMALPELSRRGLFFSDVSNTDRVRFQGIAASYSFPVSRSGSMFGYIGLPGDPALGPPVSYMRRISGIDSPETAYGSHWLDSSGSSRVFTVGYAWRALKLEGSAFSGRASDDHKQPEKDALRLDSTSTRLSYNPSPNWAFQLSRGTVSGLDQLEPEEEIRRVTISATYNRVLTNGNWQSTVAWGRNARKSHEPTMGYLLESTLRFSGTHAVFGRLEQVGSGDLVPENETARSQAFKLNRFTLGYFREIGAHGPVKLDAGAFMSRYFVPPSASTTYGSEPTSFMMFVRLNFR